MSHSRHCGPRHELVFRARLPKLGILGAALSAFLVADTPWLAVDPFAGVSASMIRPADPGLVTISRRAASLPEAAAGPRRSAERVKVAVVAAARPVNAEGRPIGEPFEAVLADLSTGGVRLLHSRFLPNKHLAVRLPPDHSGGVRTVVMSVARATAAGPYYQSAGPLVARCESPRMPCDTALPDDEFRNPTGPDSP